MPLPFMFSGLMRPIHLVGACPIFLFFTAPVLPNSQSMENRPAFSPPSKVQVLRELGHGRAARAQLVEAMMPDGRVVRCVEKVFNPGRLTRLIYRLSFQSPFGYQSNQDAIQACFYRRKVAAAAIDASDVDASVAAPLYVRFDQPTSSWVLRPSTSTDEASNRCRLTQIV